MKDKEKNSKRYLEKLLQEYIIFLDASVAMAEEFEIFSKNILHISEKGHLPKIFVPEADWKYLKEIGKNINSRKADLANKGIAALNWLNSYKISFLICGEQHFQNTFNGFVNNKDIKICIMTQDQSIADMVCKYAILKQFNSFMVCRLNRYGYVSSYKDNRQSKYHYHKARNLEISKQVISLKNRPLKIFHIPKEGSVVYTSKSGEIILGTSLETVNDGVYYKINDEIYAKIFNSQNLDIFHKEKCTFMLNQTNMEKSFCWPIELLLAENREFVGYLFNAYKGQKLQISVMKKAGLNQWFPDWKKIDIVQLARTILRKIERIHRRNILLGCLDLSSIYVVDQETVYFTETDQYQIGEFPCLLRNNLFLPPERLDYRDKIFMFSEKTENYVIAVLAFMIMMPGKAPYTQRWGGDNIRNIKNGQFPYAFKENHSKGVPNGFWRFVWSHLHFELKRAFFQTFQLDEEHNAPSGRYDTKFWLRILDKYYNELDSGEFCKNDPYSALLFPDTFRISNKKDVVYITCEHCGKKYPDWFMDKDYPDICKSCRDKRSESSFTCVCCGKTYYYSVKEERRHRSNNWKPQKRCSECKQYRRIKGE